MLHACVVSSNDLAALDESNADSPVTGWLQNLDSNHVIWHIFSAR